MNAIRINVIKKTLYALVGKYNGVDYYIKVNATVETAVAARTT